MPEHRHARQREDTLNSRQRPSDRKIIGVLRWSRRRRRRRPNRARAQVNLLSPRCSVARDVLCIGSSENIIAVVSFRCRCQKRCSRRRHHYSSVSRCELSIRAEK